MRDFITSHDGFHGCSDDELVSVRQTNPEYPASPCAPLVYGGDKEGYWMSEKFMNNLKCAANIANFKYPLDKHTTLPITARDVYRGGHPGISPPG